MTPPEANTEYSRGDRSSKGASAPPGGSRPASARAGSTTPLSPGERRLFVGAVGGGMLGALLLLIAEFTTLFDVHVAGAGTIRTVTAGAHHSYALVPIALLAAVLAWGVARTGSRPALIAIAALGLLALLIGVLGDLSDAQATGIALRGGHYVPASATPGVGLYLETLGAVVLIAAGVATLMLVGLPPLPGPRGRRKRGAAG